MSKASKIFVKDIIIQNFEAAEASLLWMYLHLDLSEAEKNDVRSMLLSLVRYGDLSRKFSAVPTGKKLATINKIAADKSMGRESFLRHWKKKGMKLTPLYRRGTEQLFSVGALSDKLKLERILKGEL